MTVHPIEDFWGHLGTLPDERYPVGVVPVKGCLRGTAFFSGATGLYWPDPWTPLPAFPFEGVIVVGHNLDGSESFQTRLDHGTPNGDPRFPNRLMATWRNLYGLLDNAGLTRERCFFTNAYVGLNRGGATAPFSGSRDTWFRDWCREFLALQVSVMRPKAVVALGAPARRFLADMTRGLAHWRSATRGETTRTTLGGITLTALAISHPARVLSASARREEARLVAIAAG